MTETKTLKSNHQVFQAAAHTNPGGPGPSQVRGEVGGSPGPAGGGASQQWPARGWFKLPAGTPR